MRHICLFVGIVLLAGCASNHRLRLDAVGPTPDAWPLSGNKGSLLVFSARTASPESGTSRYRDRYSDYKVLSADGNAVVEEVRNDEGKPLGGPTRVVLPPGTYRVVARANGYGLVIVPVLIERNRTTVVHLEGSYWWPRSSGIFESSPVRLPSDEIVGWRAPAAEPSRRP